MFITKVFISHLVMTTLRNYLSFLLQLLMHYGCLFLRSKFGSKAILWKSLEKKTLRKFSLRIVTCPLNKRTIWLRRRRKRKLILRRIAQWKYSSKHGNDSSSRFWLLQLSFLSIACIFFLPVNYITSNFHKIFFVISMASPLIMLLVYALIFVIFTVLLIRLFFGLRETLYFFNMINPYKMLLFFILTDLYLLI